MTHTYDFDPAFKDSANGDFSLSNLSQALGRGTANWDTFKSLNAPAYDILGVERPNPVGSNPDLGAYENALGKSPAPQVTGLTAKGRQRSNYINWNALLKQIHIYKVYQSDQPFSVLIEEKVVSRLLSLKLLTLLLGLIMLSVITLKLQRSTKLASKVLQQVLISLLLIPDQFGG